MNRRWEDMARDSSFLLRPRPHVIWGALECVVSNVSQFPMEVSISTLLAQKGAIIFVVPENVTVAEAVN